MATNSAGSSTNLDQPPKAGLGKRIHAWMLAHLTAGYEQRVADRKRTLFNGLHGDVLEIGPGTGPNIGFYPSGVHWIGIEPNPYMHRYLREAARQAGLNIEIRNGTAERIEAGTASVDAVVSTLVLCSVRNQAEVLQEILRVLKPGGRFVFIEHVAAPRGTRLRRFQDLICPLWKRIGDGCHPNRETWISIEQAGFASVHYERFRLPLGPVGTQMSGFAIK